ncbi:DUF3168 domain-containing protein [Sphingomonas sp. H39-1-10]|uniref:tail completion protein gp17 n=1 Tax=Sphingomonas pollutisoli TaxID=3030829 RepID=UPI0023B93D6F|nr:DUF3168 domain-containing protein [Sphingomonas pollutisoli]MDF0486786.1 DUF3168 domain-containing protein [Sphingomonas pollutisoli]
MSAESLVQAALLAALKDIAGLNGVFEGPPVKATPPYAEIGETLSGDWSVKDRDGRELRMAVTIRDAAETPARVQALAAGAVAAIEALPRDLGAWRIASLAFVRSRLLRPAPGRWSAVIEYRVRMLAA